MINLKQFKITKLFKLSDSDGDEMRFNWKPQRDDNDKINFDGVIFPKRGTQGDMILTGNAGANIPSDKEGELDNTPNKKLKLDYMPNKEVADYVPPQGDKLLDMLGLRIYYRLLGDLIYINVTELKDE
ncbi:hypothetical protein IPJ91_02385 [bacterium]|nr:MAG: hypothetical protein IPJ91_02385 [bacterium]